jgi:CPA1 family monovalent cation:H+ antiporter
LFIRLLKIKPQDNAIEEELQLYLATSTLQYIEQELQVHLDNKSEQQLKIKYELLINDRTKEIRRHKKAKRKNELIWANPPDAFLNAKIEIVKFQRELLLRMPNDVEFSQESIKQIDRELDINELKLDLKIPKEE